MALPRNARTLRGLSFSPFDERPLFLWAVADKDRLPAPR
jgi:hypothetical protein